MNEFDEIMKTVNESFSNSRKRKGREAYSN